MSSFFCFFDLRNLFCLIVFSFHAKKTHRVSFYIEKVSSVSLKNDNCEVFVYNFCFLPTLYEFGVV